MARRSRRGPIIALIALVVLGGGYVGGHALWNKARQMLTADHCTAGRYEIGTDQASVAATMVGAVVSYRPAVPHRAAVLVLAAGLQESKLANLPSGAGDRDSVGVLQQRPSQGWGSPPGNIASLNDVFEATTEFLNHLVKIDGWRHMPLAHAVQLVQISADEGAYAKHEPEAQTLADALGGVTPHGISCRFAAPTTVASPTRVAALASHDLPINRPRVSATSVRVPGAAWQTAAWFVAKADQLGIAAVSYDGHTWTRGHGWRVDPGASRRAVVATMARVG